MVKIIILNIQQNKTSTEVYISPVLVSFLAAESVTDSTNSMYIFRVVLNFLT